jgi:hypothetical protein
MVAFGRGDLDAARTATTLAIGDDPTCCCSRALAVLCGGTDPSLLAAPTDLYVEDGRCYDQLCPWRARLEVCVSRPEN